MRKEWPVLSGTVENGTKRQMTSDVIDELMNEVRIGAKRACVRRNVAFERGGIHQFII